MNQIANQTINITAINVILFLLMNPEYSTETMKSLLIPDERLNGARQ